MFLTNATIVARFRQFCQISWYLNQFPLPVFSTLNRRVPGVPLGPQVLQVGVARQPRGVTQWPDGPRHLDGVSGERGHAADLVHRVPANALDELAAADGNVGHASVVHRHVRHLLHEGKGAVRHQRNVTLLTK